MCNCIAKQARKFIIFPKSERETAIAKEKFSRICRTPQVVGAIDATHIEIVAPTDNPTDYFCRKQRYTMNTQAVVNRDMKYIHIVSGFPGSIHNARVLRASSTYRKATIGDILSKPIALFGNQQLKPMIIEDGAYPSSTWLLQPYSDNGGLTRSQFTYNKSLFSARSVVERAFGLLKAKWRCLLKRLDSRTTNIVEDIMTCCALHNICEENGDEMEDDDFVRL